MTDVLAHLPTPSSAPVGMGIDVHPVTVRGHRGRA